MQLRHESKRWRETKKESKHRSSEAKMLMLVKLKVIKVISLPQRAVNEPHSKTIHLACQWAPRRREERRFYFSCPPQFPRHKHQSSGTNSSPHVQHRRCIYFATWFFFFTSVHCWWLSNPLLCYINWLNVTRKNNGSYIVINLLYNDYVLILKYFAQCTMSYYPHHVWKQ